ncbi:MAG: hypothetical protein MNPFHGCM_02667 [Gemmatimonadaceae bacterium]|nr:hypothetical protein [Gemmatimonadaceae bacterium]
MDNICHSLAGAAIAQAGFAKRFRGATLLCVIGANIPDVDAATYAFADSLAAVEFRRGWTHGLPALVCWTLLLAGCFLWWDRRRGEASDTEARPAPMLAAAFLSVFSHTSLDWLNNYGVRWLMPFSNRWFYGDTLFIVDLVLLGVLAAGWWFSRRRHRDNVPRPSRPARIALALALAYIATMKGLSAISRSAAVRDLGLDPAGPGDLMVAPEPASILRREVLVRDDSSYIRYEALVQPGAVAIGAPTMRIPIGFTNPRALRAAATEQAKGFLRWSRFPYFVTGVDGDSATVLIGDVRYTAGTRESWAATRVVLR